MYNISDTTPLIWRIIHGMAVTKKKLAESRDRMRGHQNTCQCFEVSASFNHLSMSPRLVTLGSAFRLPAGLLNQVYQRVQFYLENVGPYRCNRNSAISERKSCSLPTPGTRSGCKHRDAPPGDYFNGILNTELPALSSMSQAFADVTRQSKWRDLRTLMEKVFNFFKLINH